MLSSLNILLCFQVTLRWARNYLYVAFVFTFPVQLCSKTGCDIRTTTQPVAVETNQSDHNQTYRDAIQLVETPITIGPGNAVLTSQQNDQWSVCTSTQDERADDKNSQTDEQMRQKPTGRNPIKKTSVTSPRNANNNNNK